MDTDLLIRISDVLNLNFFYKC